MFSVALFPWKLDGEVTVAVSYPLCNSPNAAKGIRCKLHIKSYATLSWFGCLLLQNLFSGL